jgi:hypothetical protein
MIMNVYTLLISLLYCLANSIKINFSSTSYEAARDFDGIGRVTYMGVDDTRTIVIGSRPGVTILRGPVTIRHGSSFTTDS